MGLGVETGDPVNVAKRENQQRTFKVVFELSGQCAERTFLASLKT